LKRKLIIAAIIIITFVLLVAIILAKSMAISSNPAIEVAKDLKRVNLKDKNIFIRTTSNDTFSGSWISFPKAGSGYLFDINKGKEMKINSIRAGGFSPDIRILGKYNGYIYVYITNNGINKIKDGKVSKVASSSTYNIQIISNKLLYATNKHNQGTTEKTSTIHVINLDNNQDSIIYQGDQIKGAKINANGYIAVEKLVNTKKNN
jgi:hypothetical protein